MIIKLTAAEYRALRRRPDRATLARDGSEAKKSHTDTQDGNMASAVNVARSRGYSKYGAEPTWIDGIRFASRAEARRYAQLKALQAAGEISGLRLQPRFPFKIGDDLMFTYVADFAYEAPKTTGIIVEDVKGVETPVYKLKKKIIEKYYGIVIMEVRGRKR